MQYFIGLDIGSVNVKVSLVDEAGTSVYRDFQKITSSTRQAVNSLLSRVDAVSPLGQISAVGVSGSGKALVPEGFGWSEYSTAIAVASGVLQANPEAGTIIQIGGQSSLIIELNDGLKKPWKVASNPLCAAGTGRFLEQQAYRLGISMEDFARLAMECRETPPRIAARCSVFAKSDLIHLQQKGVPLEQMLAALCESVARMVTSLHKGAFKEPVFFVGGVAASPAITAALNETISSRNKHPVEVNVPENYLFVESLGAALLSRDKNSTARLLPDSENAKRYFEMPPLRDIEVSNNGSKLIVKDTCRGYLGVDIGSTSTKAVVMDETGQNILVKHYLMTAGKPVEMVKQLFESLLQQGADNVQIAGVGVTGSGRYLIGGLIGADLVKNEITAQTRAAGEIDPEADIIEIGGQDSKLVVKRNGIVIDYQMNKACAAGTGSFIDELAETLGVSVKNGDFVDLAFSAPCTIDLGTRCAAFMSQSVTSAQKDGQPLEVIVASLANSIAKNYLSKVVGTRRLGNKIILTGAVFHNHSVVAAFRDQLPGKDILVAEHREVTGAIGAALLARESMNGKPSKFKGFQKVVDEDIHLTTFVCQHCSNNCAITQMKMPDEKPAFYGSRCDRYDAIADHAKRETAFDTRERLLIAEHNKGGANPVAGIPRSLLFNDYAPLLLGFLRGLGVRAVLSDKTNKSIMEQAIELSYSDSCFPVKLLHGHAATLAADEKVDFILFPSFIRLGLKDGEENQKYTCPLVQASPFIIRQALKLGPRLLAPTIDLSQGNDELIRNLAGVALSLGFSRQQGINAALGALEKQKTFESEIAIAGERLLREIRLSGQIGVVLLTRSYMSQDMGANLGIPEKLAQLGVVPVPLDFLPLSTVNPREYSDRPYWSYESKFIAAAALVARDKHLYGLALTNFGCGPNSFLLKMLTDIMGSKPLGQLEIDEHAAEAGIVTRLEAFVDTIKSYDRSAHSVSPPQGIRRYANTSVSSTKTVLIPRMAPHADVIAAAMTASGANVVVLPEPDERNLLLSNQITSGTECLPYRVTLGDFLKYCHDNSGNLENVEGFMSGSFGPCRLGKYVVEQARALREAGFDFPIRTTVSNNAYRDMGLGPGFERLAWKGIVITDNLQKLLWHARPYEKQFGLADTLFNHYLSMTIDLVRNKKPLDKILPEAQVEFHNIVEQDLPPRPLVGINGEIYLRHNNFSNSDLVRTCEKAGLEVRVAGIGEWIRYTSFRNLEDAVKARRLKKTVSSYIRKLVQEHDEHAVSHNYSNNGDGREPSTAEILTRSAEYISPKCGSEAVLSLGAGIEWLEKDVFAGVISVMPHGCMPGGIVAAMTQQFTELYHKPWISLTYDGFIESVNLTRINEFAELIKMHHNFPVVDR